MAAGGWLAAVLCANSACQLAAGWVGWLAGLAGWKQKGTTENHANHKQAEQVRNKQAKALGFFSLFFFFIFSKGSSFSQDFFYTVKASSPGFFSKGIFPTKTFFPNDFFSRFYQVGFPRFLHPRASSHKSKIGANLVPPPSLFHPRFSFPFPSSVHPLSRLLLGNLCCCVIPQRIPLSAAESSSWPS
jgi:hypothetical protein